MRRSLRSSARSPREPSLQRRARRGPAVLPRAVQSASFADPRRPHSLCRFFGVNNLSVNHNWMATKLTKGTSTSEAVYVAWTTRFAALPDGGEAAFVRGQSAAAARSPQARSRSAPARSTATRDGRGFRAREVGVFLPFGIELAVLLCHSTSRRTMDCAANRKRTHPRGS